MSVFPALCEHRFDRRSFDIDASTLAQYDVVVIATNHDASDYDLIAQRARLVMDSRGRYRDPRGRVVKT